ncbi:DUF1330 domain-containing protein [Roseibium sp. RKSG952]|uniref:DUF1330 domain-containing protein n=1 Tax=Roseibium sp. RKSG952 TaxID=2529384 RepID=UPI0012BC4EF1|nr:DUF1330 domain-containing protein [Roseibium sp. RKSG952]MTI01132.1 DUF1330 domain-containing protein [Roseibium sp. RKSG952]
MKKGYWIAHVDVTDPENYPKYLAAGAAAYEKYDANFLVRGGECTGPEGPIRSRHVVVEFESYQKALDCYHSPEYQAAAKLRQKYAKSDVIIVEGT